MGGLNDLRLLRTFVRIAESGGISSAARALHVPQPTVSRQLRQLENAAGVVLLRRDTHRMSLTAAGQRLLGNARKLLALAEMTEQSLHEERDTVRGHLRVVAVLDSGQWLLSRVLADFRRKHPEVTAELHLTNSPVNFVETGYDCGLLVGPLTDTSVAARKVGDLPRLLVASPRLLKEQGSPDHPSVLHRLPWMGVLQPHFFARDRVMLLKGRQQMEVKLSPVLLLDSLTASREAAVAGAGVTLQPRFLVAQDLAAGRLVQVLPEWRMLPVPMHMVFPAGRHQPGRVQEFVNYAVSELPKVIERVESLNR